MSTGRLYDSGQFGGWWSLSAGYYTSITDARSSYLYFRDNSVDPSYSNHRWYAYPLRCLAD